MANKKPATIRTVLVAYRVDTSKPGGDRQLADIYEAARKSTGHSAPTSSSDMDFPTYNEWAKKANHYMDRLIGRKGLDGSYEREIALETDHLFADQWNTPDDAAEMGLRVHDWQVFTFPNRHIHAGAYVVITDEIRELRRNTHRCGYCSNQQPAAKGLVFCDKCIDSPHLRAEELHLTRMRPIDHEGSVPRLTAAETAHLLPLYTEAQTKATTERAKAAIAKRLANVHADYEKTVAKALAERDGLVWFLERGINTENLIYYSHTKRFSWGWRSPVSESVRDALLDVVSEFPYLYEIKCADGKTYSN